MISLLPLIGTILVGFIYPLVVLPSYFASSTSTRVLLVLLVHPIVLESLEAFSRSSKANNAVKLQQQGDIPMEKIQRTIIQDTLISFGTKQLMAFFRRFMLLNVGFLDRSLFRKKVVGSFR